MMHFMKELASPRQRLHGPVAGSGSRNTADVLQHAYVVGIAAPPRKMQHLKVSDHPNPCTCTSSADSLPLRALFGACSGRAVAELFLRTPSADLTGSS